RGGPVARRTIAHGCLGPLPALTRHADANDLAVHTAYTESGRWRDLACTDKLILSAGAPMKVLVIDVGGTSVKVLASGQDAPRKFPSGPTLTPQEMVEGAKEAARGWEYDGVSLGYRGAGVQG